jgi:RNA polymerase sigma factor (sigma-70 family)
MDDLIKQVKTYRFTAGMAERLLLAEKIFNRIEPDLRIFVSGRVHYHIAQDILQEILKAIMTSLGKFDGSSENEFWSWCYRIAKNKLYDHYRSKANDRISPIPSEELFELMDISAQDAPMSTAVRHDLDYVMKLLTAFKPECHDLLWRHFVIGLDYSEIAEERELEYDNIRMKIVRCLEAAKSLVA